MSVSHILFTDPEIYEEINSPFHTFESYRFLIPENYDIDVYRRICSYKKSTNSIKYYVNDFEFDSDPSSKPFIDTYLNNSSYAEIDANFTKHWFMEENNYSLQFEGPSLTSTCKIFDLKKTDYDREFGYIQTSKIFFKSEFENALVHADFCSNLLSNEDEVLDTSGENDPFYSAKGSHKLPANESPPDKIQILLKDCPPSFTPSLSNWGCLQNQKRHQQFFVHVVMRYYLGNGKWKYDVLHSFDWFIYLNWRRETSDDDNIYTHNYGINCHESARFLPSLNIFHTCNREQFYYWIDLQNGQFFINYPDFIFEKEKFYQDIKNAIIARNQKEFDEFQ